MKANELRIGNYVRSNDVNMSSYFTVTASFLKQNENEMSWFIEPIPITKELLLKLGFIQQEIIMYDEVLKTTYFIKDNLLYSLFDNQVELNNPNVYLTILKYVHELQNLYFALTQEELTFKTE